MSESAAGTGAGASAATGLSQHRMTLTQGGMLKVQGGDWLRVLAIEGRLWIIQEADAHDCELEAGQSINIGHGGVLIQAMTRSTLALQSPRQSGDPVARFSVVGAG